MLILTDIVVLIAIAVGTGVVLTAANKRRLTNPALLLFGALCVEIVCAAVASEWLRGSEWEQWARASGRWVEFAGVVNLIRYLLPGGIHETQMPR